MDYALDLTSKLTVKADRARRTRGRYRCPSCRKSVYLRGGAVQRLHFAHLPGEGTPDCENYHPGHDYVLAERAKQEFARPLPLYISIQRGVAGRRAWELRVHLPECDMPGGAVHFGGKSVAHCAILAQKRVDLPVPPQLENYVFTVVGNPDPGFKARLERPIPGLRDDEGNVFRYTPTGGRRLEAGRPLFWGRGYILVQSTKALEDIPTQVWQQNLSAQGNWHATLVEFPETEDRDVEEWAHLVLRRGITAPRVILSLVSPQYLSDPDSDDLSVNQDAQVLLGVMRPHGGRMPQELRITRSDTGTTQSIGLPNKGSVVISLGRLNGASVIVTTTGEDEESLSIRSTHRSLPVLRDFASLTVRRSDGTQEEIPFFAPQVLEAFEAYRAGSVDLVNVVWPVDVTPFLRTRQTASLERGEKRFDTSTLPWEAKEQRLEIRQALLAVIRSMVAEGGSFKLSFGHFGEVTYAPPPPEALAQTEAVTLNTATRTRLRWLLGMLHKSFAGSSAAVYPWPGGFRKSLLQVRSNQDRDLVRALLLLRGVPIGYLPQAARLAKDLCHAATRYE